MITKEDIAYIAGLFDGEGCVTYVKANKSRGPGTKAYPTWNIRLEIAMTEKDIIKWVHKKLGVGSFHKKPPPKNQIGRKMQYRWRCAHRDAYAVCVAIMPHSKVKYEKIKKIVQHYRKKDYKDNIVNLKAYKDRVLNGKR